MDMLYNLFESSPHCGDEPKIKTRICCWWGCCGRWLLPCRLLWMAPGQMAYHHLVMVVCMICYHPGMAVTLSNL